MYIENCIMGYYSIVIWSSMKSWSSFRKRLHMYSSRTYLDLHQLRSVGFYFLLSLLFTFHYYWQYCLKNVDFQTFSIYSLLWSSGVALWYDVVRHQLNFGKHLWVTISFSKAWKYVGLRKANGNRLNNDNTETRIHPAGFSST